MRNAPLLIVIMKLRVEKGADAGRVFETEESLVTIGRALDNDLVLSDGMISQYHAKIWSDLNGKISVTDMDSANGTEVNGRQVKTAELRHGDRILLGKTVIRLVDETASSTVLDAVAGGGKKSIAPAAAVTGRKTEAPPLIDLGFEKKDKTDADEKGKSSKARFISPRVLVVMICAVVLVAASVMMHPPSFIKNILSVFKGGTKIVHVSSVQPAVTNETEIYYEYVIGSTVGPQAPDVRRYEITLKGSKLSVAYDDVRDKRSFRREKELKPNELSELLENLNLGLLAKLDTKEYIGNPESGAYSQIDFQVTQAPNYFQILVRNTRPPDVLERCQKSLETQVQNLMGIVLLPPEEVLRLAREAFENAERYRNEEQVQLGNLYASIKHYREVVEYLKDFDPKPNPYEDAKRKLYIADEQLTKKVNDIADAAQVQIHLSNWEAAQQELKKIMEMVPDEQDPRYIQAYKEWIGKVVPNIKLSR